jgi:hypothetical protein
VKDGVAAYRLHPRSGSVPVAVGSHARIGTCPRCGSKTGGRGERLRLGPGAIGISSDSSEPNEE